MSTNSETLAAIAEFMPSYGYFRAHMAEEHEQTNAAALVCGVGPEALAYVRQSMPWSESEIRTRIYRGEASSWPTENALVVPPQDQD